MILRTSRPVPSKAFLWSFLYPPIALTVQVSSVVLTKTVPDVDGLFALRQFQLSVANLVYQCRTRIKSQDLKEQKFHFRADISSWMPASTFYFFQSPETDSVFPLVMLNTAYEIS